MLNRRFKGPGHSLWRGLRGTFFTHPNKRQRPLTKRRRIAWMIAILLVVDTIFCFFLWNKKVESKFDPLIISAAHQYQVNPALVKAVVWKESKFQPDAVGLVGERGLMQIRELTAQEWYEANKMKGFDSTHLFNPQTNLYIGTWYLKKLLQRYAKTDDPIPYALCDYNAGRTKVLEWLSGSALTNSADFMERVSYPTTREYVEMITKRMHHYEHATWERSTLPGKNLF